MPRILQAMITTRRFSRLTAPLTLAVLVPCLAALASSSFLAPSASAQRVQARTLDGKVTREGTPVKGAVVHLKDTRTLAQKSYITAEDGSYRFAALSSSSDYEVWAEVEGKKTSTKTISSFDTKNAFTIDLKAN